MIRKPVSIYKRQKCDNHQDPLYMRLINPMCVTEFGCFDIILSGNGKSVSMENGNGYTPYWL